MFEAIVFYMFAAILIGAALAVITSRSPVYAALFLVLSFISASGIWMLLRAEFLAIALVLVYVGAVMVLFLFVVMMLDVNLDKLREGFWRFAPVGAVVGLIVAAEMIVLIWMSFHRGNYPQPAEFAAGYSNTKALGAVLYTDYVYPFELAAVLLLVAIVAAITLTMRRRKDTKYQNPALQVKVRREDRLRMVSMPSEKSE